MVIAVNTRFLLKNRLEGIGWYTHEVFRRIVTRHPEHTFLFLFDREPAPEFLYAPNVQPVKVWPPARHPYLWQFWFDYALPAVFRKHQPDLFISTYGFLSLKTHIPSILVVHDLGFEHYPEHTPAIVNKYYRKFTPLYARHADHIVTVSDFTRRDVIDRYGVAPEKVTRIYNGASDAYAPLDAEDAAAVRRQYTEGSDYFIYVGSIHPRKNVTTLLQAFDMLKEKTGTDMKLVVAGRMAWKTDATKAIYDIMHHKEDVIFTGHLQQQELVRIMAAAAAFVYPSLFEGFGIPVVEARYCGVPVITSDRSCLPEVAGPHAITFNPEYPAEIAAAMEHFMQERSHYTEAYADINAARNAFNWERSADGMEQVISAMDKRFVPAGRQLQH